MVDEGTDVVVLIKGIADAQLSIGALERVNHFVVNAAVDDEATGGRAALTAGAHSAKHRSRNDHLQIGIGLDDDGVVATEFEQALAESCGNSLSDNLAHADGSRCGHEGNPLVLGHHLTHFVVPLYDTGEAFGHMGHVCRNLIPDVLTGNGSERGLLRGLPNASVSANPCDGGVPVPNGHGEIECADDAHDTKGMPLLIHPVPRSLGVHGQAIELSGESHGKVADVDHFLDFAEAFLEALAHLEGYEGAQSVFVLAQCLSVEAHNFTPLRCRNGAPRFSGLYCGADGAFVVIGRAYARASD